MTSAPEDLEDLLAEALAKFDEGGEDALAAFLAAHPAQRKALERGIRRCREMGLLGTKLGADAHPERLGDYRLVRRLGGGGMGVVYEAVQEPLGRRVALKIIRPELLYFEGARERFRREVDAIARLEHPSIVPVYASGEHEGVPYFTMELLDGVTVEQATAALRERDAADLRGADLRALMAVPAETGGDLFDEPWWRLAVRVGQQIALAMRHAHLRGIVHRDIKPSNVIVTPHGQAIVLDFGVAQVHAARDLTRSGATPGSPAFMSPEQRRGQATDERTDVFSLAATIWQLVTLQRPYDEKTIAITLASLPSVTRHVRAAPSELDLVLRTAMDPDRDRRYGDMAAFAADLQAVLDRRPIAARPLGLGLRVLRWSQRHRATAVALVVAAFAGAVMVVVLYLVQRSAQSELQATNRQLASTNTALETANRSLARTNAELATAKSALETERESTRQSLDTSLEALHTVLVRLGNDQLRTVPLAERVAHGALEDAAELYRGLLLRHPENTTVRWQAGRALHALAMSFERQGDLPRALATVRESIAVFGDGELGDASALSVRAHALMALAGWLADDGDRAAAFTAIDRAEADFVRLEQSPAQRAEAMRSRGELQTTVSILRDEAAEPQACEQALVRAVALQREAMTVGPKVAKDEPMLATRVANLGKFYQRQNRGAEARTCFDEALAIANALPREGAWPPPAVLVADAEEGIGQVLLRAKDPAAEGFLRASLKTRESVVEQFPSNMTFRVQLGGAMHNYARHVFDAGNRVREALEWFVRARDLQRQALARSPNSVIALDFLAKHLEMIGWCQLQLRDGDALAAAGEELAALPAKSPVPALRAAEFAVRAWLMGGKTDASLLDDAVARLVAAEQRGLRRAQLPKQLEKVLELVPARDDLAAWRERMRTR